jgi:ABC-type multidrug transport system fused ATPase/permease subunit
VGFWNAVAKPFKTPKQEEARFSSRDTFRLIGRFLPYLKPWKRYGLMAGAAMMATVLLQLPLPLITRYVIDHVFPKGDLRLLNWIVIGFAGLLIFRVFSGLLSSYFLTIFRQRVLLQVQTELFEHVERLSLAFHNSMKVGYLMSRIGNDPQNLQGLLAETFFSLVRNFLTFVFGVIVLFFLHWKLALLAIVILPAFVYSVRYFSARVRSKSGEMQENLGRVFDVMGESLAGIPVIKSFCAEKAQAEKVRDRFKTSYRTNLEFAMVSTVYGTLTALISGLGPVLILLYGGREVMSGNLSLGSYVAFNAYVAYLYGPVRSLMGLNTSVQTSLAALKRVFEIMEIPTEDAEVEDTPDAEVGRLRGSVIFDDVTFSYDGMQNALEEVSFEVDPGEKVALVGRSGAGKTTLVNLIMRFYRPNTGTVRIDGKDTAKVKGSALRKHMGIVLQDPFIFAGSVIDNLRFGKPDATDGEVEAAAEAAYAHNFIVGLPDRYETEVGERGVRLSGGERKRLAIARAMLKDPEILILDEATSEVDTESERYIQSALDRLLENKTTFIIAHRLSTIQHVDNILVIDDGRIEAIGRHEDLYRKCSIYKKLYDEQFAQQLKTS